MAIYFQSQGLAWSTPLFPHFGIPYLSISVSLNVLLTLMIVIRLILHGRQIRAVIGSAVGISGLCKTVSIMLVESCAIFAASSLVVVGALVAVETSLNLYIVFPGVATVNTFFPILAETQVRAFPRPQAQGWFPKVTTDRAGDCFAAHCSTGRQPERVDGPRHHHWTRQFIQRYKARGTDV